MAATRRKFTVPTVEDLDQDEARQEIKVKPLFSTYTKSSEIVREARYDSSRTIGVNEDLNNAEHYPATKKTVVNETTQSSQGKDKMIVRENCVPNHDSSSREDLQPANSLTAAGSSYGKNKPTVGKTFRETFAYLEDTNHYKETVAKIKEKESTLDVRVPSGSVSTKPKSNAIIVNPRQKGNPVLKHVRNVPWEVGDIIPDYVLGSTTCALFLSLRYHHFNPEYIHERLKQLGQRFELRILLVQVDVKDPHQTLRELVKMAVMADCTLVLAWSAEEAARYLETYKVYENKPPDALLGQSEGDYVSKLTDCLTTVKGINKTDVVSLSSTFGSLANMATAAKEDLALLPGFGPLKAQRLHDLIQQPFVAKRSRDEGEGNKP